MTIDLTTPKHGTVCTLTCEYCGAIIRANTMADAKKHLRERHMCKAEIHAAMQYATRDMRGVSR